VNCRHLKTAAVFVLLVWCILYSFVYKWFDFLLVLDFFTNFNFLTVQTLLYTYMLLFNCLLLFKAKKNNQVLYRTLNDLSCK